FFGTSPLGQREPAAAAAEAASILRGTMEAVAFRGNAVVPLTAGWDSRVLLAASRDWKDQLSFFVDGKGTLPARHPDIRIPRLLANRLKLDFQVRQSAEEPEAWFCRQLGENVTSARLLPKTRMIWDKFRRGDDRININGNGS